MAARDLISLKTVTKCLCSMQCISVRWPGTQFIDKELATVLGRLDSSQMQYMQNNRRIVIMK